MTRLGVVVAALVAAGAAVAQPRRPDPAPGVPLVTRLPAHLADPALLAELKLAPEQVKALTPAGPGTGGPAAAARAKDVLTPEQYRRAVQLMAQDALRAGRGPVVTPAALVAVPAATFRRHPELAEAAHLTREQARRVTLAATTPAGPGVGGPQPAGAGHGGLPSAPHVVLDPDQTAALAAFVGPLRTTPFAAPPAGPPTSGPVATRAVPPGGPGGLAPPAQRVMLAVNNRGELGLSDEQVATLTALLNAGRVALRPAADGPPPTPPRPPTPAGTEAALAKALTPPQLTRLRQIELWQVVPRGADDTAKFAVPRVAAELALTAGQKADLDAVGRTHRERAAHALDTAESAAGLKTALAAARAEVTAAVGRLLTAEQAAKLRDLFGPEYRGAGPGMTGNDIFRRIRAAGFGHYQFEIMVVNRFAGVAEDLKLTEDQKAAMTAAETAFNQQFRQTAVNYDGPEKELAKQMSDRSKAMERIFADHLTAEQRRRFRELCVQLRQQLNANQAGGGAYPATGAPGVADELKLTAEQRKRIIDTGDEDDVLTPEQRAGLKRLAGPPMPGGFNFGGPPRGRAVPPSPRLALLHAGTAHADLGLDADQAYLVAAVIEEHAAELRPAAAGRSAEPVGYVEPPQPEAVEDAVRACEKACHSVLTPAQRDRLGQLVLQVAAQDSLTAAFARPEVAEKLALTPEQRARLDDIAADHRARVAHVAGLPDTAGWPDLRGRALREMREKARGRMLAVLTDAQTAAWRELTGAPCPAVAAETPGDPGRDP